MLEQITEQILDRIIGGILRQNAKQKSWKNPLWNSGGIPWRILETLDESLKKFLKD